METKEIKQAVETLLSANNIVVKSVFVPFSQSRNKNEKTPCFNYLVTVSKNGVDYLTTDYSMGCAHSPSYKKINTRKLNGAKHIKQECELGYQLDEQPSGHLIPAKNQDRSKKFITPDTTDVMYSLLIDSDVIEYSDFESWASEFGYDSDSRAAEKIYRQCLKTALKLRQFLPDSIREELQELYQGY